VVSSVAYRRVHAAMSDVLIAYQSGRSYLEPLETNLPNMPDVPSTEDKIVRINDGNDSNNNRFLVMHDTEKYKHKFYNTSIPNGIEEFNAPVVLTINPNNMTDDSFYKIDKPPVNLMFVRFRSNTWNIELACDAADFYEKRNIPLILTFMAYNELLSIPIDYQKDYIRAKRTLNEYWCITYAAFRYIITLINSHMVYTCGRVTNDNKHSTLCMHCGNCIREYYNTKERMKNVS
jgi:hypothetical protein